MSFFGRPNVTQVTSYITALDKKTFLKNDSVDDSRKFYTAIFTALQSIEFSRQYLLATDKPIIRIFARGIHENIFEQIIDIIDSTFKILYVHLDDALFNKIRIDFLLCRNADHINNGRNGDFSSTTYEKFLIPLKKKLQNHYNPPLHSFRFFFAKHDVQLSIKKVLSSTSNENFLLCDTNDVRVENIPSFTICGDFRLNRIRKDFEKESHMAIIKNHTLNDDIKDYLTYGYDVMKQKSYTQYSLAEL
jgi:hypothetical protein